jgi:hypothetical protein
MGQSGGEASRDKVFVTELETFGSKPRILFYDITSLAHICADAPANGYTLIIVPAFSQIHSLYARRAPDFEDMFVKPVVGWVSGVHLDDLATAHPMVVNGQTGSFDDERIVAMHVELPPDRYARIDIINRYSQSGGDRIRFPETGFSAGECQINGSPANLADYLVSKGVDTRLPLVADYCGAMINVSIKGVDSAARRVDFYAPVFEDVEYRLAGPVGEGAPVVPPESGAASFSCNCILNYLHDKLEGHHTGGLTGPMTFGEIAYLLLNQTLVYLTIERA